MLPDSTLPASTRSRRKGKELGLSGNQNRLSHTKSASRRAGENVESRELVSKLLKSPCFCD